MGQLACRAHRAKLEVKASRESAQRVIQASQDLLAARGLLVPRVQLELRAKQGYRVQRALEARLVLLVLAHKARLVQTVQRGLRGLVAQALKV